MRVELIPNDQPSQNISLGGMGPGLRRDDK
jgi:hypothetical protein